MTDPGDPGREGGGVQLEAGLRAEAKRLGDEIARLARSGPMLPGSLTCRQTRCGRDGCRCMADPPQLHGPYWSWTRKIEGKTVTRYLSDDEASTYKAWFDNARRLRALISELEGLGLQVVDADQAQVHDA